MSDTLPELTGYGNRRDEPFPDVRTDVLLRFVALYTVMYGAFGVSSPFMPAFFGIIPAVVPPGLAATAQAMYALAPAAASAVLTMLSGRFYARLGGRAFLVMALLCAAAAPLALVAPGRWPSPMARDEGPPPRKDARVADRRSAGRRRADRRSL